MKKSIRLFLVVACVSTFVTQAQTKRWTLEECIALALEKNVTIKQNELDYASAELDRLAAKAAFLPSLSANANHSWNIGLNQNITTGLLENVTTQFLSLIHI